MKETLERITLSNGDCIRHYKKGIIIDFAGRRLVSSTSVLNGGCRDDLKGAFNFNCLAEEMSCVLHEDSYELELAMNAKSLDINPDVYTGLSTAAWMENASFKQNTYKNITVSAIVTAGIDKNATRVGDPASFYEESEKYTPLEPGTINILLHVNCNMAPGVLNRVVMTASKAACIACEELMIGSLYSNGLATGSGTDGIIAIADPESDIRLTNAGEHSKLGEMIGITVKAAVQEALYKQTGACTARAHSITARGKRYGITVGSLWKYLDDNREYLTKQGFITNDVDIIEFEQRLNYFNTNSTTVIWCSLYYHLLDQFQYGLIEWPECIREAYHLSSHYWQDIGITEILGLTKQDFLKDSIEDLLDNMKYYLIGAILGNKL